MNSATTVVTTLEPGHLIVHRTPEGEFLATHVDFTVEGPMTCQYCR